MRTTEPSDLRRRAPVRFSERAVESPHTAKTGRVRNLTERQRGFVDQFLGEVQGRVLITAEGVAPRCWRNSRRN